MKYRDLINKKGLTVTFVASKLGVKRTTLNNYLFGVSKMPESVKKELDKLLKK